jgi:hypothetical protein
MRRALLAAGTIGLISVAGMSTYAVAAPTRPKNHTLIATVTGALISLHGTSGENIYKVTSPIDGTGAGIYDFSDSATTPPLSGKGALVSYYANGVQKLHETFKLSAPNASGITTLTGSGKCVGGTRVHKNEKCTYSFTGTENLSTFRFSVKLTGTYRR